MPKHQDRCAELKKEAAKARKQVVISARKDVKIAMQEQKQSERHAQATPAVEAAAAARVNAARVSASAARGGRGGAGGSSRSTFDKARLLSGGAEEEDDDEAEEEEAEEQWQAAPTSAAPAREPSNTVKKRQQVERHADELRLLAQEQRAALRQRVLQRLLHLLIIGFVLDSWQDRRAAGVSSGKDGGRPKEKKKANGSRGGAASGEERARGLLGSFSLSDLFGGPFLLLAFTVAMLGARLFEEGYHPDMRADQEVNLYEVLGLASDADVKGIRKAYKALAQSWHPDKNPGCEACAAKFARISTAYETLSSPERRKAYDQRRSPDGSLDSVASAELSADDFEALVSRSNDVWLVQIYDPGDGLCRSFHPVWEDVALSHREVARFGRIDASRHRRALDFLPQRVVVMPIVFRFARGKEPEIFLWSGSEETRGSAPLARFVTDGYPTAQRLTETAELRKWWDGGDRPKLLLAGPLSVPLRGARSLELLQVQRLTHVWAEFADAALVDGKLAADTLGQDLAPQGGTAWTVSCRSSGTAGVETRQVRDLKNAPAEVQELVSRMVGKQVPAITVRNYQQLCGASGSGLGRAMRTFCLILVDPSDASATTALGELEGSRVAYAQELIELKSAGEEAEEEPFHIQPVRIMTRGSRLPWRAGGAGSAF
mmetsp:Transcript_69847/g.149512  ORF Transcript_69847/g.149512 Transcript_69847/m.149512 type:complete len:660 (-) Transcript_69847:9-1988(-)